MPKTVARNYELRRGRDRKRHASPLASRGSLVDVSVRRLPKRGPLTDRNRRSSEPIPARLLEQEWLWRHQAEHAGAWVALEGASLVAKGTSARQVLEDARSAGHVRPLVVHVPTEPELLPFGGW